MNVYRLGALYLKQHYFFRIEDTVAALSYKMLQNNFLCRFLKKLVLKSVAFLRQLSYILSLIVLKINEK